MSNSTNQKYREFLDKLEFYFKETVGLSDKEVAQEFIKTLNKSKRVFFTATGSSIPSALYGSQFCSEKLNLPAQFVANGQILSSRLNSDDLVILSSQGLNRGDAELVIKKVKEDGAKLVVLTANQESLLAKFADFVFYFAPFPEKLFCRPVGVQTAILAMQIILTGNYDPKILEKAVIKNRNIFDQNTKYIVLSSGVGMPVAINYSLALREGCGIDANYYDIETYGYGMYVSDKTLEQKGQKLCYILINIDSDSHCNASVQRITKFTNDSSTIFINSKLPIPYCYYGILTNLAEDVYATNIANNYDMNQPFGKEQNRYYHNSQAYLLPKKILELSKKENQLILISGGSCVGKSTIIKQITKQMGNCNLIAQDNYQLGKDFAQRKTSIYKYDDPKNFQIERCAIDIKSLIEGNNMKIPSFNLVENIAAGTQIIKYKQANLLEGIYAFYGELAKLPSFKIYIEAPYYIRFLRRITRFVNTGQNTDLSIPLRHITTSVYLAHKDFVIGQKEIANLVIQADEIIPRFLNFLSQEIEIEQLLFEKNDTQIGICNNQLLIKQDEKIVYISEIDKTTKNFLLNINWIEK